MGIEDVAIQENITAMNNMSIGYNADGTVQTGPFMTTPEYAMMGGMSLYTLYRSRGMLGQKPTWNGKTLNSVWEYGGKALKANFSSPSNFLNMEFIDSHVATLERIMAKNTPVWPEKLGPYFSKATPEEIKVFRTVFDEIVKAPNRAALEKLLNSHIDLPSGRVSVRTIYETHLRKHLPTEVSSKLQNIVRYNEIYGATLNDFRNAQTRMRSGNSLGKGTLDALHKSYEQARIAENQFITATEGVLGVERKVAAGSRAVRTARMTTGVRSALAGSKSLRLASRSVGRAGGVLMAAMSLIGVGMETYDAAKSAKKGNGWKDGSRQALKSGARATCEIGGAWAGMKAGAFIGGFAGPVGAAVGGIIGSIVGWAAGSFLAKKSTFINKSVAQENAEKQNKEMEAKLTKAIETKDVNTLATYSAQFKEQAVDEKGNPLVDEEGNPILQYVRISTDPKIQKEFEDKVASLDNYVETEVTKQQRAEELRQQEIEAREREAQEAKQRYENLVAQREKEAEDARARYNLFKNSGTTFGTPTTQTVYSPLLQASSTASGSGPATDLWRDKGWQASLEQRYNSGSLYTYSPVPAFNYNMMGQGSAKS